MESQVAFRTLFDTGYHFQLMWAPWGGFLAAVLISLFVYFGIGGFSKLPKLPIALLDEIPNRKERIERYNHDTRNLLVTGYNKFKDQIFGVTTTEGTNIVVPLRYLDDLKGHRALSFAAFLEEEFTLKKFTKLGNLTAEEILVVNKELNPTLPKYTPVIHQLIRDQWPLENYDSFTPVKIYPHMNRLVSRITARFFQGTEAATNERWIDLATIYINSAIIWTGNLKKWPKFLRPFVYPFVSGRATMMSQFEEGKSIVSEALRKKKANGNKPLNDPPSLLDHLSSGKYTKLIDDVESQTVVQMNLCVAAIQSMAATITQCLIDVSVYPEYVPELREELNRALEASGGVLNKQALSSMIKLDSFMKETQRLNSPDLTSFQRKVAEPLTMSNGMHIPKGARLVLPTGAINMDNNYFESPDTFDGMRFYNKRRESEDSQTKYQLVTVGKTDLAWGYGRHACPGRFIAEVAMKLVMIEFLLRYDLKHPHGGKRPKNIEFEGVLAPDPEWELLFKDIGK